MTKAYCVKCKKTVDMLNGVESKTSRGTFIMKGKCGNGCGTTVCRIVGKK